MIDLKNIRKIYLMPGYTDLRLGIDGYSSIVVYKFGKQITEDSIYIFCNKARNKIKILHYEDNGFWLYYKRLAIGHIRWPKNNSLSTIEKMELISLLNSLKLVKKK